jgi:hypothetical protein
MPVDVQPDAHTDVLHKAIRLPLGIPDQHEGGLRSIQKFAPAARTHESGLVQEIGLKYDPKPPD